MGVYTYEEEVSCSIPPHRLFKSFVLDNDNLMPKVMPQFFKSCEILEGDGGVGTIKLIHFAEGSPYKSLKQRIDALDEEHYMFKYTVIEGDVLEGVLDSISHVVKIESGPDGGSVCKTTSTYHTKEEGHHHITEDKIKAGKEKAKAIFKAVEAHLHAHPNQYV